MQFTGLCCCGLMINILNDQSPWDLDSSRFQEQARQGLRSHLSLGWTQAWTTWATQRPWL